MVVSAQAGLGQLLVTLTFTCTNGTGATFTVGATNPQTNVEYQFSNTVPATCDTPGASETQALEPPTIAGDAWNPGDQVIIQGIFRFSNGPTVVVQQTLMPKLV